MPTCRLTILSLAVLLVPNATALATESGDRWVKAAEKLVDVKRGESFGDNPKRPRNQYTFKNAQRMEKWFPFTYKVNTDQGTSTVRDYWRQGDFAWQSLYVGDDRNRVTSSLTDSDFRDHWKIYFTRTFNGTFSSRQDTGGRLSLKGIAEPGDIVRLTRKSEKYPHLLLIYMGEQRFSHVSWKASFFVYPYTRRVEYNTWPPRLNMSILVSLRFSNDLNSIWQSKGKDVYYDFDKAHQAYWVKTDNLGAKIKKHVYRKYYRKSDWARPTTSVEVFRRRTNIDSARRYLAWDTELLNTAIARASVSGKMVNGEPAYVPPNQGKNFNAFRPLEISKEPFSASAVKGAYYNFRLRTTRALVTLNLKYLKDEETTYADKRDFIELAKSVGGFFDIGEATGGDVQGGFTLLWKPKITVTKWRNSGDDRSGIAFKLMENRILWHELYHHWIALNSKEARQIPNRYVKLNHLAKASEPYDARQLRFDKAVYGGLDAKYYVSVGSKYQKDIKLLGLDDFLNFCGVSASVLAASQDWQKAADKAALNLADSLVFGE